MLLVFSFILMNGISQNILLSTDFQQGIPSAYSIVNSDNFTPDASMTDFLGQNAWIVLPDPENPSDTVAAATSFFETADSADRWLITPPLALASFGNFLSWNAKSHDPSFPDDYLVLVSTTDNQLASFTDTIGNIEQENFEWTNREVNLSTSGYNDSTIYVAFVLRTFDGFKLCIESLLKKIKGMFSFAIWDENKKKLFAARDRFGIKPFVYYKSDDEFIFASELKAIANYAEFPKIIDENAISDFLIYSYIPFNKTVWKDTFKLPPAHYLEFDYSRFSLKTEKYWELGTSENIIDDNIALVKANELIKNYGSATQVNITGNYRLGDIRHNYADLTKIKSQLGFTPKYNFEKGIKKFTDWVLTQEIKESKFEESIKEMKEKGLFK